MKIDAEFPDGMSLEALLKHIKKVTTDASYTGIPIYVDPRGSFEAKNTMESRVDLNFKGQTIGTVLATALRPNGLSFHVHDGFLLISSRTAVLERRVEDIDRKLDG